MMMMMKAESTQQRGLSAGMSETAAAHGEAVESVKREKKARRRPDDGTEFCGVRRRRSGKHGAQIWERSWRGNVWLGTFGTAEEAAGTFDAAAVELRGAAAKTNFRSPAAVRSSASVAVVKEETAQEQGPSAGNGETAEERGNRVEAAERRKNRALPDAQNKFENVHKYYYKRRKDRFFQQLEALHGPAGAASPVATAIGVPEMVGASDVRPIAEPPSVGATAGMDGMIREEAWRRQEILAQERAVAATRDAAVLSFIQKFTGLAVSMPSMPLPPPSLQTHAAPPPPSTQPQPSPRPQKLPTMPPAEALVVHQSSTDIVMTGTETPHDASGYGGAALSSRWAKTEVQALIQLRNNLVMRRNGARGAIWEEISAGMRRMGYSRSSKQCRKKWWGMNYYYYKKVKQSKTKRPEESKTCPSYFHQLEALYRDKAALGSPSGAALPPLAGLAVSAPILHTAPQPHTLPRVAMNLVTSNDGNGHGVAGVSVGTQTQAGNGGSVIGNRFVYSDAGGHAAEEVIKLETNVHPRVATGGAFMWHPAPTADGINPEHVQEVGLKQAPVAATRRTAAARSDSRSGYRGVRLDGGRYLAQIRLPGRPTTRLQLGTFDDVEEAARAYDAAAWMLYGTATKTNFEQPPTTGPAADDLPELQVRSSNITAHPASGRRVPQGDGLHVGGVSGAGGTQMQASNRFFSSDQSSMDFLNDLPEPPVRGSTISVGVGAEVEEFLKAFTDMV